MTEKIEEIGLFDLSETMGNQKTVSFEYEHLFDVPKRRDVKGLKDKLNDLEEKDEITIIHDSNRYGTNIVQGSVCFSDVGETDNCYVGGINLAKKSHKNIWDPVDTNVKKIINNELFDAEHVEEKDVHTLNHGDLILVQFTTLFYGEFAILGLLVAGEKDHLLLINKWIVSSYQKLNPSISRLVKIADSKEHSLKIPELRQPITLEEGEDL